MWLRVRRYGAEGLPGDERVASPACWSEPRLSLSVPWVASSVGACPPINTLSWPCTGAFLWCRVDSRPGHAGPRRSKQKMLVTVAPRHGHARGACKVSIGGHGRAAVLMGAARRMMGTDRQHTKASVCLVASARCCVTGLPLPQAPPAAPRALAAAPGPSRRQVRAQWARAPWIAAQPVRLPCGTTPAEVKSHTRMSHVRTLGGWIVLSTARLGGLCVCGWCAATRLTSDGGATGAATCVQCSAGTYSGASGASGPLLHQC